MKRRILSSLFLLMFLLPGLSGAADRKMVIQLNSKDPLTKKMAMLNAKNLKTQLGKDAVDVEIVLYGPGLSNAKKGTKTGDKLVNLMTKYGIKLSVCGGALKAYEKRHGQPFDLIDGATKVKTGAIRILELQEQGYAYLRP